MQRAALDQHRGHRAAAAVQVGLDGDALAELLGVGPQVQLGVRGQDDGLEQLLDVAALAGGHVHEQGRAAELLSDQVVLGELGTHPLRVRPFLVDLVDRNHDRHPGRLGVVQRLRRLRLHAVVGRDHEHHEVGGLRPAGTHGGEGLVTRGVDERDLPLLAVHFRGDLVGTDVLGDAARFAGRHVGVPDRVEELGLAVVDVAHHGHHRRPGDQGFLAALVLTELDVERLQQLPVLFLRGDDLDVVVELRPEQLQRLVVHRLGGGDHLAQVEHDLDQRGRVDPDLVGEVAQRRATGQPDGLAVAARDRHAADRRRLHVVEFLAACLARLPGARGPATGAPEGTLGAAAAAAATAGTPAGHARARSSAATATAAGTGRTRAGTATAAAARASARAGAAAGTTAGTTGTAAGATAGWPRRHAAGAGTRPAGAGHVRRAGPSRIARARRTRATGTRATLAG